MSANVYDELIEASYSLDHAETALLTAAHDPEVEVGEQLTRLFLDLRAARVRYNAAYEAYVVGLKAAAFRIEKRAGGVKHD